MDPNYIIYAEGHTGDHFYFQEGYEEGISLTPEGIINSAVPAEMLQNVLISKKRQFTHNKVSYIVVARGRTYEP